MNDTTPTLTQIPLFPLQSVLFPGGLLPLRIFEVRYLDMIGRCHKAATPFGVVCLTRGTEVRRLQPGAPARPSGDGFADEAFFKVGTLAAITELDRPQPGLMMIRCTGTQRFRIHASEQLKHGLWTADVEMLADDAEVALPDDLAFTRSGLQHVLHSISMHTPEGGEPPMLEPYRWNDCGWLANRWAELLPISPEIKQRFMALENPLVRLELVADALNQIGFKLPPDRGG